MTKARDLANAADVLDDVSATELSYVNGVTSAIQTQLNNKQAVVANVNDTEIGYLDGVTSAIQTQLDAKVAKSLVDAKGDLLVGSANDTVSRLAVASTAGYLLSVDSAEATGLKWAAPAGGELTISQIASGTLTSGNSLTFSSLSSYDTIAIWLTQIDPSGAATLAVQVNGNTTSDKYKYNNLTIRGTTFTQYSNGASDNSFYLTYQENLNATTISNSFIAVFENCKSAGFTRMRKLSRWTGSDNNLYQEWGEGMYINSETVSSLVLKLSSTDTFQGGNYVVWGG